MVRADASCGLFKGKHAENLPRMSENLPFGYYKRLTRSLESRRGFWERQVGLVGKQLVFLERIGGENGNNSSLNSHLGLNLRVKQERQRNWGD